MRTAAFILLTLWMPVLRGQPVTSGDILRDAAAAYQSGDTAGAIRLYRQFLADHPNAAEIRSNLGAALAREGQFAEAIQEYQAALKDLPNNVRVRMNLALAYYKIGRYQEAIQELEIVHERQPLEVKSALLMAECLLDTGQAQKAVELLKPLQEEYPEDRAVMYLLGMALLQQNRTQEAQATLDRILRGGESAEAEYLLGQSEYSRQNVIEAAKHLARAVELKPDLPGVHSLYGQALRSVGKPDEAIVQFGEELKVNPYDFTANTERAMELKQDGKLDEALVHIGRALQVRPKDPGVLYQRALIHGMQGHAQQAREELERLVADYPDFAEAHAALATVYYRMKRTADGDRERAASRRAQEETERRVGEKK